MCVIGPPASVRANEQVTTGRERRIIALGAHLLFFFTVCASTRALADQDRRADLHSSNERSRRIFGGRLGPKKAELSFPWSPDRPRRFTAIHVHALCIVRIPTIMN